MPEFSKFSLVYELQPLQDRIHRLFSTMITTDHPIRMETSAHKTKMEGQLMMRCRRDGLYRSRRQRQRATQVETRTKQTVVGTIRKEKTNIVPHLLFVWAWL